MAYLLKSLLGLSFLMSFTLAQASQCGEFLNTEKITFAAQELVLSHSVYSPWYYNILKEKATTEELLNAFEKADEKRLKVLAEDLYENLVNSERLALESSLSKEQIDVLTKSLVAIKKTKRFPMQVEVKEVSSRGKVWFGRGALAVGAPMLAMSFFMPATDFSTGLAGIGAVSFAAGVVRFVMGTKHEQITQQASNDVVDFIMSEGGTNSLSKAHDRFTNKKGELIESSTSYEVHQYEGQYFVQRVKPS